MLHHEFALARRTRMPSIERRAYSQSRVTGRRLYIDVLEAGLLEDLAVDDAVIRDPARKAQPLESGRALQTSQPIDYHFFEPPLHRRRDRNMPFVHRLGRTARRTQPRRKEVRVQPAYRRFARAPRHLRTRLLVGEILGREHEIHSPAVRSDHDL